MIIREERLTTSWVQLSARRVNPEDRPEALRPEGGKIWQFIVQVDDLRIMIQNIHTTSNEEHSPLWWFLKINYPNKFKQRV